jgi:hypothetical protein
MSPLFVPNVAQQAGLETDKIQSQPIQPSADYRSRDIEQLGRGLSSLGTAFGEIGSKVQDQADEARLLQHDNLLSDVIRQELYFPDSGFMTKIGGAANANARQQAQQNIQDQVDNLTNGLDNDAQKTAFAKMVAARTAVAFDQMARHEAAQTTVFHAGQLDARTTNAMNDALNVVGTPQFDVYKNLMIHSSNELAQIYGKSPEEARAMQLVETTKLNASVVQSFLDRQQPDQARKWLEQVPQGEIAPLERARLEGLVRHSGVTAQADALAENVMSVIDEQAMRALAVSEKRRVTLAELPVSDQLTKWLKQTQTMANEGKISAEVHLATDQILEHRANVRSQARAENVARYKDQARNWAINNPLSPPSQIPATIYDGLSRYGELGALSAIEVQAAARASSSLRGLISLSKKDIQPLNDEIRDLGNAQAQAASGMDLSQNPRVRDLAQRAKTELPAKIKLRDSMQQNINEWDLTLQKLLGRIAGKPLDEAPPKDPIDLFFEEMNLSSPTPPPQPANPQGGK